jgi:hypothetical protein
MYLLLLQLLKDAADQDRRREAVQSAQASPGVGESVGPQSRVLDVVREVLGSLRVGPRCHQVHLRADAEEPCEGVERLSVKTPVEVGPSLAAQDARFDVRCAADPVAGKSKTMVRQEVVKPGSLQRHWSGPADGVHRVVYRGDVVVCEADLDLVPFAS